MAIGNTSARFQSMFQRAAAAQLQRDAERRKQEEEDEEKRNQIKTWTEQQKIMASRNAFPGSAYAQAINKYLNSDPGTDRIAGRLDFNLGLNEQYRPQKEKTFTAYQKFLEEQEKKKRQRTGGPENIQMPEGLQEGKPDYWATDRSERGMPDYNTGYLDSFKTPQQLLEEQEEKIRKQSGTATQNGTRIGTQGTGIGTIKRIEDELKDIGESQTEEEAGLTEEEREAQNRDRRGNPAANQVTPGGGGGRPNLTDLEKDSKGWENESQDEEEVQQEENGVGGYVFRPNQIVGGPVTPRDDIDARDLGIYQGNGRRREPEANGRTEETAGGEKPVESWEDREEAIRKQQEKDQYTKDTGDSVIQSGMDAYSRFVSDALAPLSEAEKRARSMMQEGDGTQAANGTRGTGKNMLPADFQTLSMRDRLLEPDSKVSQLLDVIERGKNLEYEMKLGQNRNFNGTYQEWSAEDQRRIDEWEEDARRWGLLNSSDDYHHWSREKLQIRQKETEDEWKRVQALKDSANPLDDEVIWNTLTRAATGGGDGIPVYEDGMVGGEVIDEIGWGKPENYDDDPFAYDAALYDAMHGEPGRFESLIYGENEEARNRARDEVDLYWSVLENSQNQAEAFRTIRGYDHRDMEEAGMGAGTSGSKRTSIDLKKELERMDREDESRALAETLKAQYGVDGEYHSDLDTTIYGTGGERDENGNLIVDGKIVAKFGTTPWERLQTKDQEKNLDMIYYMANHPFYDVDGRIRGTDEGVAEDTRIADESYFMTTAQRETFNTLYNAAKTKEAQGLTEEAQELREQAQAFLDSIQYSLSESRAEWMQAKDKENASKPGIWGPAMTLATALENPRAGAKGTIEGIKAIVNGESNKYGRGFDETRFVKDTRDVRGQIWGEGLQDVYAYFGGEKNNQFMQRLGSFAYGVTSSVLDNVVSMLVAKGAGNSARLIAENMFTETGASLAQMAVQSMGTQATATAAQKTATHIIQTIMSSEAASMKMVEMLEKGRDPREAGLMALVSGAVEAVTEKYSIEALFSSAKSLPRYLMKNMLAEGTEEVAADLLNTVADLAGSRLWDRKSEIMESYDAKCEQLVKPGMTEEEKAQARKEAGKQVLFEYLENLGTSFLAGWAAGGMLSGGRMVTQYGEIRQARGLRNSGRVGNLLAAAESYQGDENYQQVLKDARQAYDRNGGRLSIGTTMNLLNAINMTGNPLMQSVARGMLEQIAQDEIEESNEENGTQLSEEDMQRAVQGVTSFVMDGKMEDWMSELAARAPGVVTVIETLLKGSNGQQQNESQIREIQQEVERRTPGFYNETVGSRPSVRQDAGEGTGRQATIRTAAQNAVDARNERMASPEQLEAAGFGTQENAESESEEEWTPDRDPFRVRSLDEENTNTEENTNNQNRETTEEGQENTAESRETAAKRRRAIIFDTENGTKAGEFVRKEGNHFVVRDAGGAEHQVDIADARAADEVSAATMRFLQATGADDHLAGSIWNAMQNESVNRANIAETLAKAREMYVRGALGENVDQNTGFSVEAAEQLYKDGAAEAREAERNRQERARNSDKGLKPGRGQVHLDSIDVNNLNEDQKKQITALGKIARKVGFNIRFINDEQNKNRFGSYDPTTGSVIINLAGSNSKTGMQHHMMVTASHELTHLLEANSPEAYAELRKFVFDEMRRNGVNMADRIQQKMDNYNLQIDQMRRQARDAAKTNQTETNTEENTNEADQLQDITVTDAIAETVADACDQVLGNEDLINQMAEDHPSLYAKVKDFVKHFVGRVKAAMGGMRESGSLDSLYIENVDELAKKWGIALRESQQEMKESDQMEEGQEDIREEGRMEEEEVQEREELGEETRQTETEQAWGEAQRETTRETMRGEPREEGREDVQEEGRMEEDETRELEEQDEETRQTETEQELGEAQRDKAREAMTGEQMEEEQEDIREESRVEGDEYLEEDTSRNEIAMEEADLSDENEEEGPQTRSAEETDLDEEDWEPERNPYRVTNTGQTNQESQTRMSGEERQEPVYPRSWENTGAWANQQEEQQQERKGRRGRRAGRGTQYSLAEDGVNASDWIMGLDPNDLTNENLEFYNTKNVRKFVREYQKGVREIQQTREKIQDMKNRLQNATGDEARKLRINIQTENNKLDRVQKNVTELTQGRDFGNLMRRAQNTIETFLRGKTQQEVDKGVETLRREGAKLRTTASEAAEALETLAAREDKAIANSVFNHEALTEAAKNIKSFIGKNGDMDVIADQLGGIALKLMTGGEGIQNDVNALVDYMIGKNWADYRFSVFGGRYFNVSEVQGELRQGMVDEVVDAAIGVIPQAMLESKNAQDESMKNQVSSLVDYVHRVTENTRQTARGMRKMEQLAADMEAKGEQVRKATKELQGQLQSAIRYFDLVNEQNRAAARADEIEQITRTLESKAAKRVLEVENKWARRMENDRNTRLMREGNMALRRKINTAYTRMAKLILNETDQKNIPEHMKPTARAAIRLILNNDVSGGHKITGVDLDTLRRSKQTMDAIDQRDGTDLNLEGIEDEDVRDTILQALQEIDSGITYYNGSRSQHNSVLEGDKAALQQIQKALSQIYDIVSRSREIFLNGKMVEVADAAFEVDTEARNREVYKEYVGGLGKIIRFFKGGVVLDNMTPEYFFKNMKNNGLNLIYQEFKNGEDRYGRIMLDAKAKIEEAAEKNGYKTWDMSEKHGIDLENGDHVELTLEQMMSLWATWQRENTLGPEMSSHLTQGGFVYEEQSSRKVFGREAKAMKPHRVTTGDMALVESMLTEEQKNYVNEMVSILSNDMARIGNEASMRMSGIEKYKEKYYFPFTVWDGVKNKSSNSGTSVNPTNNNRAAHQGFTNRRVNNAQNAVMLQDFTKVCAQHINQMAVYSTMGSAIEGMNRVLNFRVTENGENRDTATRRNVEAVLTERYGKDAVSYIRQFLQDLNGGAVQNNSGLGMKLMSIFKKNAVGGSLSVALQQPLSYVRASTMISTKYLAAAVNPAYYKGSYQEMLRHSGVAVIKDMGKFDMNFSQGAAEWLTPDQRETGIRKAYHTAEEVTNELPVKMDQMTWTRLWTAVKLEQHQLHPEMDMGSDEFLDMCGERFNDIMRKTQVYDSVLVKSQLMRNQGWFAKSITAFRAEPTLTLNLFMDAVTNFKTPGGKKNAAAVAATYLLSAILQAAIKGIMSAGRNPDEKKTLAENFAYRFGSQFIGEANPLSLIPGYDNIVDLLSGNDINDNAWGMIKTLSDSMMKMFNPPKAEELNAKTGYRYVEDTAGQVAQMFSGIPAKNLMRDSRAIYTWFMGEYADRDRTETDPKTGETKTVKGRESSGAVMKYQLLDSIMSTDLIGAVNEKMMGGKIWNKSNTGYYERMYEAEKAGDKKSRDEMEEYLKLGKGVTQKSIDSGISGMIKKDESLTDAEKADYLLDNGYADSTAWITQQFKQGGITEAEVRKLYAEHFPDKNPDESLWNYWSTEYKEGRITEAEAKKKYLQYHPKKTEQDAMNYLWGEYQEKFKEGQISEAEAMKLYRQYHPKKTDQEVRNYFWGYHWQDYKDGKITEAEAQKLYKQYHPNAQDKDLAGVFWGKLKDDYAAGEISRAELEKAYKRYYPKATADDVWWAMDEIDYKQETGRAASGAYYRVHDAIEGNNSSEINTAVKTVMKHGKKKEGVLSSIEGKWKETYLGMKNGSAEKVRLKDGIIKALKAAGYTASQAEDKINGWGKKKGK